MNKNIILHRIALILLTCFISGQTLLPFTNSTPSRNVAPIVTSPLKNPHDCSFYIKTPINSTNAKIVLLSGLFATFSPVVTFIAAQNNNNLKTIIDDNYWLRVALVLSMISGAVLAQIGGLSLLMNNFPILKLTQEGIIQTRQSTPWDTVEMVREKKDRPFLCFSEKSFAQVLLNNGNLIKLYCNNNIVLDKDRSNPISAKQLVQLINHFLKAYSTQSHDIPNKDAF